MITFKINLTSENTPFDIEKYLEGMGLEELNIEAIVTKDDLFESLVMSGKDGEVLWLVAMLIAHYKKSDNEIVKMKLREINNLL